jgi:hypothetical protein
VIRELVHGRPNQIDRVIAVGGFEENTVHNLMLV